VRTVSALHYIHLSRLEDASACISGLNKVRLATNDSRCLDVLPRDVRPRPATRSPTLRPSFPLRTQLLQVARAAASSTKG
jgi:hypothetical protein